MTDPRFQGLRAHVQASKKAPLLDWYSTLQYIQCGAPKLWLLVYNPNFHYGYLPTINPSEIVCINQLNAFERGPHITIHYCHCLELLKIADLAIPPGARGCPLYRRRGPPVIRNETILVYIEF